MATRVSPTERIRAQIDDLFATEGDLGEVLEEGARLGARLLLQSALEAEVTEFLGRNRYERRQRATAARGSRNGYGALTIKTTAGPITLERPKLRGTEMACASRLLGIGVTKTNALESLVIAGFVRGLSVRDVEAALAEALEPEAQVSRSTVSRICEAIKSEFDRFKEADLWDRARVPVDRRKPLQDAPRGARRTGPGRLGHRHRRKAAPPGRAPGAAAVRLFSGS